MLRLSVLGPFQATLADQPDLRFPTKKVRALLVYLAMHAGQAQERAALVGLLWPEMPEDRALNNLSKALGLLRQALHDGESDQSYFVTNRQAVLFRPDSDFWLDAAEFRQGVTSQATFGQMARAVELYRGEFLAGLALSDAPGFEAWLLLWRERLHQQMLALLARLATRALAAGNYNQAQKYARRQLELDVWQEAAHAQLMRALALAGDRSGALRQYEICRDLLAVQLGVEPDASTTALYGQIKKGMVGKKPGPGTAQPNLPAPLTPLLGRSDEVARLVSQLQDPGRRLVVLVGEGGAGKTRLALAVASQMYTHFQHGVWFVPLAGLSSESNPSLINDRLATAVAAALGLPLAGKEAPSQRLRRYLSRQKLLLLLDNFEHLPAAAGFVVELLEAAPSVKALITSRARLNVRGESFFMLQGLPVPAPTNSGNADDPLTYASVQLFISLAHRLQADLVSERDVAAIVEICRQVDGLPLGIELAASLTEQVSCTEIARALRANADLPTSSYADVPPRQRSLSASFAYSWRLLSTGEQRLLARLSVFRGGFTRAAASQVSEGNPGDLDDLVRQLLVHPVAPDRYEMHQRVRQYAAKELGREEADRIHERHSAYYLGALAYGRSPLTRDRIVEIRQQLRPELDNIRLAWDIAVRQGNVEALLEAGPGLSAFFYVVGLPGEAERALRKAVARVQAAEGNGSVSSSAELATLQTEQAFQLNALAQSERALATARQAESHARSIGDLYLVVRSALQEVHALRRLGNYEASRHRAEEALMLAQTAGFAQLEAHGLRLLAYTMIQQHHDVIPAVRDLFEKSLNLYRQVGDVVGELRTLTFLSGHYELTGFLSRARTYRERVLIVAREVGNAWETSAALLNVGGVYAFLGDFATAESYFEQSLALAREIHNLPCTAYALDSLGLVYGYRKEDERALACNQEAVALAQSVGERPLQADVWLNRGGLLLAMQEWAAADWALREAQAIAEALDLTRIERKCQILHARVLLAQGQAVRSLRDIEPLLMRLAEAVLVTTFETFKVYNVCLQILVANKDERAADFKTLAQHYLQSWASRIDEPSLRRSFLENFAAHRDLAA
jgi:predicted ATPase/DNA-binding SARP family transcriptional activator